MEHYDIFISYSRKNTIRVLKLKKKLEKETCALCWFDWSIESGTPNFTKEIIHAINTCPIFLFMLSKESQESEYAIKELDFAYKRCKEGKKVVIVFIEQCKMSEELEFNYGKADTIAWDDDMQQQKLIHNICDWIGTNPIEDNSSHNIISILSNLTNRYPKYREEIDNCINSIASKIASSFSDIDTPIFESRLKNINNYGRYTKKGCLRGKEGISK